MADEIMQELWTAKDAIAQEANYDLDKLCQLLKQWQAEDWEKNPVARAMQDTAES